VGESGTRTGSSQIQTPQSSAAEQSKEQIKKKIEEINKKAVNSEAVYGIHEETNRVTIKIIDKETKEVIKELPPEKTLDMIAKVWELAGLMVDEKR
jgi:flagellar protein FlaG